MDRYLRSDALWLALATLAAAILLVPYQFGSVLSENDLYWTALGLWDGYHSGTGIGSTLHYGRWFSFGYIELFYALAGPDTFADRHGVIALMSALGFWSTVACVPLSWLAGRVLLGAAGAWAATLLFTLSPVFLELAGSQHQVLPATAILLGASALLWAPLRGLKLIAAQVTAALLLALALSVRFEVAFVFPLLTLAHPGAHGWRAYLRHCAVRLPAQIVALAVFFTARHLVLGAAVKDSDAFLETWYRVWNAPIGVVTAAAAIGLVTSILLLVTLFRAGRQALASAKSGPLLAERVTPLLGPLAGLIVGAAFWFPNPLPGRHFLLFGWAAALLIGAVAIRSSGATHRRLVLAALAIAAGNQLASAAIRPLVPLVSKSPLRNSMGVPTQLTAGDLLTRRRVIRGFWAKEMALADEIATSACDKRLVVLSGFRPEMALAFLRPGWKPQITTSAFVRDNHTPLMLAIRLPDRHVVVISRNYAFADDVTDEMLAHPWFADYRFLIDPYSVETADDEDVPAARQARLGCR